MKLEILIPQYNETEDVIRPLLDSIEIQQNVDFNDIGVIICNDGSDIILSQEFLDGYSFNIKYIKCEHRGVSATRNTCLDNATAEYVMFCDADDLFYNACALYIILEEIKKGFDSLTSLFIEETRNPETKEVVYINREMDVTFVHGKVHNRKFLVDNQIRWNETLTVHEDSYFNILCKTLAKNFKYIPVSFYLWKWRDTSVCRNDEKYMFKTYKDVLESNKALVQELLIRGYMEEARFYVTSMIFEAYYTLNKPEWRMGENEGYKNKVEKSFKGYYTHFKDLYNTMPENIKNEIVVAMKNRMYHEGLILEKITFEDWIKTIEEK